MKKINNPDELIKFIKNNLSIIAVIVFALSIISMFLFIKTNELTDIEKVIKNHNAVKESILNTKYPTLSKPYNSQSTIINGDSVRVLKNKN